MNNQVFHAKPRRAHRSADPDLLFSASWQQNRPAGPPALHGLLFVDEQRSEAEDRFWWVGTSASGRVLTIRFTRRGARIRIIGAAEWRECGRLYHSVKITIAVDADSLAKPKDLSAESGVPYQRLLTGILKKRLAKTDAVHARPDRIERELARVKRSRAA